jgi:hypothetical protein
VNDKQTTKLSRDFFGFIFRPTILREGKSIRKDCAEFSETFQLTTATLRNLKKRLRSVY